ncbi:hypothetical protein M441DRAFT_48170 [Trichoderma asperellum CBS 433.97]|uniref:Uncharacterized protein n=1 Tax=Trichoderma asperellum (strain ATCC 204424 / CBS 433.97 / NBRC 101777) TaxID=1042311 RepID=A0A2T3Z680_TRIA4|nr:hypothetical protein M441DRAFT_48170 [Trichoderma asperellum CBS 433.97]PTB40318.1 hypothetical protein M441DRAFT_48170 [Trichoderma asperellum CBS 433.97]
MCSFFNLLQNPTIKKKVILSMNSEDYHRDVDVSLHYHRRACRLRQQLDFPPHFHIGHSRWGVIDFVPITNFPDIRSQYIAETQKYGNLMVTPREDIRVGIYVQLDHLHGLNIDSTHASVNISHAARILVPLASKEGSINLNLAERASKIACVLKGHDPALLQTYAKERLPIAKRLIEIAAMFCDRLAEHFAEYVWHFNVSSIT